eukprot:TRINITY_DN4794_c0_g1_i1.p1 TRINITY_DN4794_c0_g1~~TRINITY_DN4794_c0_g1_i1.p1  ORF type:complete len:210 (-),score=32.01 TRINITY_DN4794_c0_g1_i1:65-694(-)
MAEMSSPKKRDVIPFDLEIKMIVIGDSGVGKSSLLMRFDEDKFTPNFISTIGIDVRDKYITMKGKKVKLRCWDSAGQERFKNITANYYRGVHGVLLVYNVTDMESFKNVLVWAESMANYETSANVKVLVGNKCDLIDQRVVSEEQGTQLAAQLGCKYFETSAKTSINCEEAFMTVARECFEKELYSTPNGQPLIGGTTTTEESVSNCPC